MRVLGGALLRREKSDHNCLLPFPGAGHLEKQHHPDKRKCELCRQHEITTTEYLTEIFCFLCVKVDDRTVRNELEKQLIATFYHYQICRPGKHWLGKFAYPHEINSGNLCQSDHVYDEPLSENNFKLFLKLISESKL